MNPSDVLAKMGFDAPRPMLPDPKFYGLWFRMMAPMTNLSDEELADSFRNVRFLNEGCFLWVKITCLNTTNCLVRVAFVGTANPPTCRRVATDCYVFCCIVIA
jgi:hypothetical protein